MVSNKKNIFLKTKYDADKTGHFGKYGGRYVPEMLIPALEKVEKIYLEAKSDPKFLEEIHDLYDDYAGRPTPLFYAKNSTEELGGAKIYIKNEGLNHTGAHKMNHCLGQALLAERAGIKRIIAETGAGQHGLASATVAAKFGMECIVYMGEVDYYRQRPNVFWMEQLGAEVVPVKHGTRRLKDAVTAALQDWITNDDSWYLLGSALGPHPYPSMVRDFQTIVGLEAQDQLEKYEGDKDPDYIMACVGGGSNSIGIWNPYLDNENVNLVGVEAGGKGIKKTGDHATRLNKKPKSGIVEGYKSFFLQDDNGQVQETHSISAGLDYAGIGPQHAYLFESGRAEYQHATDKEVLDAFKFLARNEGVLGALESLHGMAYAMKLAPKLDKDKIILVNMSGRAEKDIFILGDKLGDQGWTEFLEKKASREL